MKAITCSQCGALIKGISMQKKVAVCKYCGSEMFLEDFKKDVIEIPDNVADKIKTKSNWEIYLEKRKEINLKYGDPSDAPSSDSTNFFQVFFPVAAIVLVIGFSVFIYYTFNSTDLKYSDFTVKTEMSYSYQLKAEKPSFPAISREELTEKVVEELKKLPADKRNVQVKVRINEKGSVVWANAETENSILRKKSEKAALNTTFYPTGKVVSETITYYFYYR